MKPKKKRKVGNDRNPTGEITEKEKRFCEEYIKDFDASRAYAAAGYKADNPFTVNSESWKLRQTPRVYSYLQVLQEDVEKMAGISRLQVLKMHMAIVNTSIAHLHKTWVTREEFEKLTTEQKMAIQEIDTKTKRIVGDDDEEVEVEYIRIKLYDRQKALDAITRMLGYDEPSKLALVGNKELIKKLFPFGE